MSTLRLQSALAKSGIASRRKAAFLIESGRIKVNGLAVREKGFRVDILRDKIAFGGKVLSFGETKHYYILNKPRGVFSTASDERGRKTVLDYVKKEGARLYPVGRLDKDTTGLILITNDGDLTYRLTHPKFEVPRVYEVKARGAVGRGEADKLKSGVMLDGKTARIEKIIFRKKSANSTFLLVTLREGRKREVRRIFEAVGHKVLHLKRISFGPLRLGGLREGETRELSKSEITKLKKKLSCPRKRASILWIPALRLRSGHAFAGMT